MAKTRFSEEKRNVVHNWMMEQYDAKNKDALAIRRVKEKVVQALNVVIRKKYQESDMVILRKYNCSMVDNCIRLVDSDTNAVFGIELPSTDKKEEDACLADIPQRRGCNSQDVYPIDPKGHALIDEYLSLKETSKEKRNEKSRDYKSFLAACRYVEDAHEVVPFPKEMQERLFSGGAVILINEDIIAGIKAEFAMAKK